jgi:hypothetical protein
MVTTPPAPVEEGQAPNRGTYKLLTGVYSLDKSLSVLEQALGQAPDIPEEIMTRTRLRSDAMRLMNSTRIEEMEKAEELFTMVRSLCRKPLLSVATARDAELTRVVPTISDRPLKRRSMTQGFSIPTSPRRRQSLSRSSACASCACCVATPAARSCFRTSTVPLRISMM